MIYHQQVRPDVRSWTVLLMFLSCIMLVISEYETGSYKACQRINSYFEESSDDNSQAYFNLDVREADIDDLTNSVVTDVNIHLVFKNISDDTYTGEFSMKPFESDTWIQLYDSWSPDDVYNTRTNCPNGTYTMIMDSQASRSFDSAEEIYNCSDTVRPGYGSLIGFNGYYVNQVWQIVLEVEEVVFDHWCLEFDYYIYDDEDDTSSSSSSSSSSGDTNTTDTTIVVFLVLILVVLVVIGIALVKYHIIAKKGRENENSAVTIQAPNNNNNDSNNNTNNDDNGDAETTL